jgi:uncharacterized membrane protein YsdA (DUF1294 family)/cold shock CspA family protein
MRYLGRLQEWNDGKGFGFVTPNGGGTRAFVHIKAFERATRRPVMGDLVSYEQVTDQKGRLNASKVRLASQAAPNTAKEGKPFPGIVVGILFLAATVLFWLMDKLPLIVPLAYSAFSLITYVAYGMDKSAAQRRRFRTSETTLHLFALLGGWPGGMIAQEHLRHKSRKTQFRFVFWITVLANFAALAWLLQSGKAETLNALL